MRAPPLARMRAVAAPRPEAEPVTIAHKPSFDIAISSFGFKPTGCALPYRAAQRLQIGESPLRGISNSTAIGCIPPLQGGLRRSALVMTVAFPHHRAQEKKAPDGFARDAR